jgi:hypothetical protein
MVVQGREKEKVGAAEISAALRCFFAPGEVTEIRIPDAGRLRTVSGYFNDFDVAGREAARWSGQAPGIYFGFNPVPESLLARANNRLVSYAKVTTADADVTGRRWFFADFDPKRPTGISSTDAEHEAALAVAAQCRDHLSGCGWPSPLEADSGNGGHLLYPCDLPNDDASRDLFDRCLKALDFLFSDDVVQVDLTTFNAARITKLYGTAAGKGDSTPDRPHRISHLLQVPTPLVKVSVDKFEALARMGPPDIEPGPKKTSSNGLLRGWDLERLERWIRENGVEVHHSGPWKGTGKRWILPRCPWNPAHTNLCAFIVRWPDGIIGAGCRHNGCKDKDWQSLRDLYEPDRRPRQPAGDDAGTQEGAAGASGTTDVPDTPPWPDPPAKEAFHGLAGRIVRTIEPSTEADPAALLVQALVAFGSVAGRGAHFRVEASSHFTNEFVVLVGRTSKARKGTSWDRVVRPFEQLDEPWFNGRVVSGVSSGEGIIWAVRDPVEKRERIREKSTVRYETVEADPGIEDKRLLIYEPEFAGVLRQTERYGNTASVVLRQAWDGHQLRTLTKNCPACATGAHLSLVGHITSEELRRYLTATETANGFGNRFLFVAADRSKLLPEGGHVDADAWNVLRGELAEAVEFAKSTGEVRRDQRAGDVWKGVYGPLSEGKPGLAGSLLARAEAHVMRLALLYALLDKSPEIQEPHLMAALALWDYCDRSVRFTFGDSLGDPVADELLRLLRASPNGLTRTEMRDYFQRHESADRIARALGLLLQHKLARREEESTGGRPSERWFAKGRKAV